ncbi:inverse autotransporter beta domain-containing protein [Aeromonas hydrophila]|uniref:inverse autotransporter beta domain-containing protein n=1 Tax=Aeromonas hydrophila TaxID=644 RepID=UPI003EC7097B
MDNSNRFSCRMKRVTAWVLLSLYTSVVVVSPVAVARASLKKDGWQLVPYSVVAGDTLYDISQRHGLTVDSLIELNRRAPSPLHDGDLIKVGQVIYVPSDYVAELPDLGSGKITSDTERGQVESLIASQANRLGQTYGQDTRDIVRPRESKNNSITDEPVVDSPSFSEQEKAYLHGLAHSAFESEANERFKGLLGGLGHAETELSFDDEFRMKSYSADLLMPLVDTPERMFFVQAGGRHDDSSGRSIINLGVGQRHFSEEWMLGYNAFFDHDITRDHNRLGLGFEAWADYFKLSANIYTPLSDWKDSPDFDEYLERAARGVDLNAKYYLPQYPHLGLSAKFEQYFGDEVDLLGSKTLERNPYAGTLGLEWQPVPLFKMGVDRRQAKGGQNDTQLNVGLEWKLGASLDEMLNPANVAASRQLQGMRYDLVERNNNIVLEYKEKERAVTVEHPAITGVSGEAVSLSPVVSISKGQIVSWRWSSLEPLLQGALSDATVQNPTLTLPVLPPDVLFDKEFTLFLTVTDERGRTYQSAPIPVLVNVNPELLAKRLTVISTGYEADSIDSPDVNVNVDDAGTEIDFVLARYLKVDTSSFVTVEAQDVIFEPLEHYLVEQLPGGFQGTARSSDRVWVNRLKITPKQPGVVLPPAVLSFYAKGAAGQASGTVNLTLKSATTNDLNSPRVSNLRMKGLLEVGQNLTATYDFNSNGGDANDASTYVWGNQGETAGNVSTGQTVVSSGQVPALTLIASDVGEVKEVSVQAKNGLAITGNTVTVDARGAGFDSNGGTGGGGSDVEGGADSDGDGKGDTVIDPAAGPQVSNLNIVGRLEVGQSLTASYTFNANGGNADDRSTYAWGNKGETAVLAQLGNNIITSGQVPAMTLTSADVGEVKEVSVQAKNALAITGNTVTVDSSMGAGGGDNTSGGADTDGDGKGDAVINPANYVAEVRYTSTANEVSNGVAGIRPVAQRDEMTAYCQMDGEAAFTPCEGRYTIRWFVRDERGSDVLVSSATGGTFMPRSEDQGRAVLVEVTAN